MIFYNTEAIPVNTLPGLTRKTLAHTTSLMICEFTFDSKVEIPIHSHPHEQVGYLVDGQVEMTIADHKYILSKGDSYCAPANVPHGVLTLTPTIIVDTFYPPREDYL